MLLTFLVNLVGCTRPGVSSIGLCFIRSLFRRGAVQSPNFSGEGILFNQRIIGQQNPSFPVLRRILPTTRQSRRFPN